MCDQKPINAEVLNSVNELVAEFKMSPYEFLYESDLQAVLIYKMRARVNRTVQIPRAGGNESPYKLNAVYSEYGGKIDVVCLDLGKAGNAAPLPEKGFDTYIYSLPVAVGIELKYQLMGYELCIPKLIKDFRKLIRLGVQHPLVLGFLLDQRGEKAFLDATHADTTWAKLEKDRIEEFGKIYVISPKSTWVCTPASAL